MSGEKESTPPAANNGGSEAGGCVSGCNAATPYEKSYGSAEDAAVAAMQHENPGSVASNSETAGWVQDNGDGTFTPRAPVAGDIDSADPGPKGASDVAVWHTHGGPDPRYDSENFSNADRRFGDSNNAPVYVSTPTGVIKRYNPSDSSEDTLPQTAPTR